MILGAIRSLGRRARVLVFCRLLGRHEYFAPAFSFDGFEIADEWRPKDTDTAEERAEKLLEYSRLRCRHCGHIFTGSH